MDYNKLMDELDREINSSFESVEKVKGLSAVEGYDEIEKDLMDSLGSKDPIVEVEGEEDLVFDDGEGSNPEEGEEEVSPEEVLTETVGKYFTNLLEGGLEAKEAKSKVLAIVNSALPEDETEEEGDSAEEPSEEVSAEEAVISEDNFTESPEEQKEIFDETVKELASEKDMNKALSSFEEYQKDKEAKMLKRYKQLANKDEDKKKVAIEGVGEVDLPIDERAISRVSGEFGYSGKNLRTMVAEAIQRGEI